MPTEFTTNYQLAKPDFNLFGWHDEVNGDFDLLDAILFAVTGLSNFVGNWTNSTNYIDGQRVIDPDDATIWNCLVDHTSAPTDSMVDDRTANPTYWSPVSSVPYNRGQWLPETFYAVGDTVYDANEGLFGSVVIAHTSSPTPASMRTDIANFSILFDSQVVTEEGAGVAKAWGLIQVNGTISAGHNVASVSHPSTGDWTVNLTTPFSSVNYAVIITPQGQDVMATFTIVDADTFNVKISDEDGSDADAIFSFAAYGTQP